MIPSAIPPQSPLQELIHGPSVVPAVVRTADKNIVYGMCTLGEAGRILDRTMLAAVGWYPGSRLKVRCLDEGVLLISDATDLDAADTAVTADRFFRIPYRQRRRASLFVGDHALLIGHRARRRL